MRRALLAPLTALVVAVPMVTGALAAPAISITSPAPGATFSKAASPTIAVTGTAGFAEPIASERTFYLRGEGCGGEETFWLSTLSGDDGFDGCGYSTLPIQELIHQVDGPTPYNFTAEDGVPVLLDASRDVAGTIRSESWLGDGAPGVGQVVVDVTLRGRSDQNQSLVLGSDTVETVNTGTDGVQADFTIDLPDELDRVTLNELTLDVEVHGVNWNSNNLGLSGDSSFALPILDGGRVDVSSDSSTFLPAKTVQALVNPDGTWVAEIATPSTGNRKIYARAVQAGVTTQATPVSIVVTS